MSLIIMLNIVLTWLVFVSYTCPCAININYDLFAVFTQKAFEGV